MLARRLLSSSSARATLPQLTAVGDVGRMTRTFTAADVAAFAELTHDDNPLHDDGASVADGSRFGGAVVHGANSFPIE